jgi:hypothetical protein
MVKYPPWDHPRGFVGLFGRASLEVSEQMTVLNPFTKIDQKVAQRVDPVVARST